jgi:hypothetical protein
MKTVLTTSFALLLLIGVSFADIQFSGDVSVDFDENSIIYVDANGEGDVYIPYGISSTGWDFYSAHFHYDRNLDRLYIGLDFNGRICGDADGDGDPAHTGTVLDLRGGRDVADLGNGETVCIYFDTDNRGGYDVICGIPRTENFTSGYRVSNCLSDPNGNPSSSFGSVIQSASGSYTYHSTPSATHPDFECTINNFSQLPGFNFDPATDDVIFRVGAYAGSWEDDGISNDVLSSSKKTITFYSQTTIPHTIPRDLYVMMGVPVVVDNGNPEFLYMSSFGNPPYWGWPYCRVSRWNHELQTYERYNEQNWPIAVGGDPQEQDPGRGFWVVQDYVDNCQIEVTGTALQPGWVVFQNINKPLHNPDRRGLTQLANPFHVPVQWGDAYLRDQPYGGPSVSIESAVNQGIMCRYAVTWDPYNLEYITHEFNSTLNPWDAYWTEQYRDNHDYVMCFEFPSTDNTPTITKLGGSAPQEVDNYSEWHFTIGTICETTGQTDMGNYMGIINSASDEFDQLDCREYTPMRSSTGFVQLYFPHSDWTTHPDNYCYDFRNGGFTGEKIWNMEIRSDGYSGNVDIVWDGIFKAYPEYELSLLDGQGNTLVADMHTTQSLTVTITDGETQSYKVRVYGLGSGVKGDDNSSLPKEFNLTSAYPNPFNNSSLVTLNLPVSADVKIALFDVNGRLARTVANRTFNEGSHSIVVDASGLASGMYFLRAETAGNVFAAQKLVLLK